MNKYIIVTFGDNSFDSWETTECNLPSMVNGLIDRGYLITSIVLISTEV